MRMRSNTPMVDVEKMVAFRTAGEVGVSTKISHIHSRRVQRTDNDVEGDVGQHSLPIGTEDRHADWRNRRLGVLHVGLLASCHESAGLMAKRTINVVADVRVCNLLVRELEPLYSHW